LIDPADPICRLFNSLPTRIFYIVIVINFWTQIKFSITSENPCLPVQRGVSEHQLYTAGDKAKHN